MEIKKDAWNKFTDIIDTESNESNFKIQFKDITKKYGQAYIEYCKAAWSANFGVQTEDEFMQMNGGMPRSFFEKNVRVSEETGKAY
jgi:hypothetical protein